MDDPKRIKLLAAIVSMSCVVTSPTAWAQQKPKYATEMPTGITAPAEVETRLGTLRTQDGFPDEATIEKVYDNLDFQRGVQSVLTALPAASLAGMRKGLRGFGPDNQTVVFFEKLMDSRTVKAFGKAFGRSGKELTKLYKDHGATASEMQAVLDELNAEWEGAQTRSLDLRFKLKDSLSADEWKAIFGE